MTPILTYGYSFNLTFKVTLFILLLKNLFYLQSDNVPAYYDMGRYIERQLRALCK